MLLGQNDRTLLKDHDGGIKLYLRQLSYCLTMPTSVSVVEKKHLTDLSILKQCVLFHNIKASVMIYKLAKIVP